MRYKFKFICLLGLFLLFVFSGCKKDQEDSPVIPGNYEVSFTPAAAPQYTGVIIPMSYRLSLHPGDVVTLSARVYDQNGTQLSGSANLTYSLTDNAQAVISGNQLTANQPGISSIEITDGIHTPASILVEVLPDSQTISPLGFNIQFNDLFMVMPSGSTQNIVSYTITNLQGQVVSATPVFFLENTDLGTVSGNTITASSLKGMTRVKALLNGDTLLGHLNLIVQNRNRPTADTAWSIFRVRVPEHFSYYQKVADPVSFVIHEAITPPGNNFVIPSMRLYTATPLSIEIEDGRIINQVGGQLISVRPGLTRVKANYRGGAYFWWYALVHLDLTGSWQFKNDLNYTFNLCFSQPTTFNGIYYKTDMALRKDFYHFGTTLHGTSLVQGVFPTGYAEKEGTATIDGVGTIDREWAGPLRPGLINLSNTPMVVYTNSGVEFYSFYFDHNVDKHDEMVVWNADRHNPKFIAKSGLGNCRPTVQPGLSLEELLTQNTNRIWRQSVSFIDYLDYSAIDLQFLSNGSYIDRTPYDSADFFVQPGSTTWLATADNQNLVLRYTQVINLGDSLNPGPYDYQSMIDTLRIATYSTSRFNIRGCNIVVDGQRQEVNLSSESPYLYWE
jgi:hypothetical protein